MADKHSADEAFETFLAGHANRLTESKEFVRHYWRAAWEAKQAADVKAVESEPELLGPMPDEVWGLYQQLDREGLAEALRTAVRATKSEIKRRITGEKE